MFEGWPDYPLALRGMIVPIYIHTYIYIIYVTCLSKNKNNEISLNLNSFENIEWKKIHIYYFRTSHYRQAFVDGCQVLYFIFLFRLLYIRDEHPKRIYSPIHACYNPRLTFVYRVVIEARKTAVHHEGGDLRRIFLILFIPRPRYTITYYIILHCTHNAVRRCVGPCHTSFNIISVVFAQATACVYPFTYSTYTYTIYYNIYNTTQAGRIYLNTYTHILHTNPPRGIVFLVSFFFF